MAEDQTLRRVVGGRLRGHDGWGVGADRPPTNVILAKARIHDTSRNLDLEGVGDWVGMCMLPAVHSEMCEAVSNKKHGERGLGPFRESTKSGEAPTSSTSFRANQQR